MATGTPRFPVHSSLTVLGGDSVYQTNRWWKAVLKYRYETQETGSEVAVYLWHYENEKWKRKNKYVVKTPEAWNDDRPIIERYLNTPTTDTDVTDFPVSDYYRVAAGETVFKMDTWWKAIVHIAQKGSYETSEVGVYLWQKVNDQWRRRQKYAIKNRDDWETEREFIETALGEESRDRPVESTAEGSIGDELDSLQAELENHLSVEYSSSV